MSVITPIIGAGKSIIKAGEGAVTTTEGFVNVLSNPNTWLRVGEVVLGLLLIAVGLARLTHAGPVVDRLAKTAAKVGAIAA